MHFYSLNISIIRPLQPPIIPHHTNTPGKFLLMLGNGPFWSLRGEYIVQNQEKGEKKCG